MNNREHLSLMLGLYYVTLYQNMSEKKKYSVCSLLDILADNEATPSEQDSAIKALYSTFFE